MSHNVPQCPTMTHNVPQCPTMIHNVPQCPTMSHNVPQCPTMSRNDPQCPTMSHNVPQCPPGIPGASSSVSVGRMRLWWRRYWSSLVVVGAPLLFSLLPLISRTKVGIIQYYLFPFRLVVKIYLFSLLI